MSRAAEKETTRQQAFEKRWGGYSVWPQAGQLWEHVNRETGEVCGPYVLDKIDRGGRYGEAYLTNQADGGVARITAARLIEGKGSGLRSWFWRPVGE